MTPSEIATAQARLADAREKYHLLATGQQASVFVDPNGERVEFFRTGMGALRTYIRELEAALGVKRRPSGPMGVLM